MTEQDLISRGYKKYPSNRITFEYSDYFYQRRIEDEKGIKYFINLVHYSAFPKREESWMVALTINQPFYEFKQHFINLGDIQKIEENCEKFFKMFNCEYYEINS